MAESLAIIDREMGASPRARAERAIVRRMIHASADFDYESNARFHRDPIDAAISALRTGRPVLTDVEMLRAGIRRDLAGPLGVEVLCALDEPGSFALAASGTLTRSAAGMRRLAERAGHGAIVAVGNAPTAVMEALRLIDGGWRPGCLVAIPVGFVGVEEAKRAILSQELVPAITSVGRKGGTAVTAAAVNALMELAAEARSP